MLTKIAESLNIKVTPDLLEIDNPDKLSNLLITTALDSGYSEA